MRLSSFHCPVILVILRYGLLSQASMISLSTSTQDSTPTDISSFLFSSTPHLPTSTTIFSPLLALPSALPTIDSTPRHPRPSHRVDATREAITVAGVLLLSSFIIALVFGLIKFARSYWRTPHRNSSLEFDRWQAQLDAPWFDAVLGADGLLNPPPPPYFPRPPSYDGACLAPKDDSAVSLWLNWDGREQRPSSRRHSV
ncbi:hypothetical protein MVEN_00652400 [Mycena venus]|uniref:Uncharacterized protein n=1 Tax=Mycena venus TaxID=2733690 RepID=A0A8H6YQI2_9AGAR|nr:hypothetical protein MVEN_00652400 [Mycena venus]